MKTNYWQPIEMTLVLTMVLTVCLVLTGGCGSSAKNANPTLRTFTMNFTGFTPEIGKTLYLRVTDTTNSAAAVSGEATPAVLTSDNFTVTLPKIIKEGDAYQLDFWVDEDGNAALDHSPSGTPAGMDHSWRRTGIGTASGLQASFVYSTSWMDITPW